ncbi:glycosyltransferase [Parvularcula sp. IMCC14364]|uniref:glycosyltransferase n=1 Tax=Parvularcula sp. IMCC14364 TaxID=3067902 RepID=UPI00274246E8|nr:glycosyltransferase [Parvularcula sp. IMCC14364]
MRVVSSYWPRPERAHNAFFEVDQVRAFAELGHDVDVMVQTVPWKRGAAFLKAEDLELDPERVHIEQVVMPRLPEALSRREALARLNVRATGLRMQNLLKKRPAVDAIIVNGERNIGLSAGIWNRDEKHRVAMIVHGADPVLECLPQGCLHVNNGSAVGAGLARVILVGNRLRSYAAHVGYAPERVAVIANGFRHPAPPKVPIEARNGPVRLIAVARLVPVKGIDDALVALSYILAEKPELDWAFDILGDGPEREALEALTTRLGLTERVHFHGAVPHSNVLRALEGSDIFLLPSWNEAFGLAYLEAMAMGNAVVGCLENGAADILTNGVDGCLVPPRDVSALSALLTKLMVDREMRLTLASAAIRNVKRFSWESNARAILRMLDD